MKALLQRVQAASVVADGQIIGEIGPGLLIFVCAEHSDTLLTGQRLIDKIVKLRVFSDDQGKMNRSVLDVQGELLIVSQFTLAADTSKGNRPSYTAAAPGEIARQLYDAFVNQAKATGLTVASGAFGADMQVCLVNDGPVTIPLAVS